MEVSVGKHEAYRPTLSERASESVDSWLHKRGISKLRLPKIPRGVALPYFAFFFVAAMIAVTVVDPYAGSLSAAFADDYSPNVTDGQSGDAIPQTTVSFSRGGYDILTGAAFNNLYVADAGIPDQGTAQAFARQLSLQLNWGQDQYSCLVKLWTRESNWNYRANNSSSGAYGIPQALPGNRMAAEGSDWATNPETQIRWGVKYIENRYKNPCNALVHSNNIGWY
jgi:hypothetical protein